MPSRSELRDPILIFSWIFISIGVVLRLVSLSSAPFGWDIDESMILSWALKSIEEGKFRLYAPEWTGWEMLAGYFYGLGWKALGPQWVRAVPALLSVLEIVLVGMVAVKTFGSRRAGWIAAALLAVCPWHFYYSRILGTCVGAAAWALLLELGWVRSAMGRAALLMLGFFHYTVFRLFWILEGIRGLKERERLWAVGLALFGVLFALLGVSSFSEALERGSYNLFRPNLSYFSNYLGSALLPFAPIRSGFEHTTSTFMADYVHAGLAKGLGLDTPLSWGVSLLVFLGLLSWKKNKSISLAMGFSALGLVFLGALGPSLSRGLFFVPWLILIAVHGLGEIKAKGGARVEAAVFALVLIGALGRDVSILRTLSDRQKMEPVFQGRVVTTVNWLSAQSSTQNFYFIDHGFFSAKFLAERAGAFTAYLPFEPTVAIDLIRSARQGKPQWVVFDQPPDEASDMSGFDKRERIEAIRRSFLKAGVVQESHTIERDGRVLSIAYRVEWPS